MSVEIVPSDPPEDYNSLARKVYYLRMVGRTFDSIAMELELTPQRTSKLYRRFVATLSENYGDDEKTQAMQLELDRLDQLQEAVWVSATEDRDQKSIETVLKIMDRRAKVLGFGMVNPSETNIQSITLVSGSQEDFIAALREGRGHVENVIEGVIEEEDEEQQ